MFPSLVSGSTLHQLPSNWLVIIDFSPLFLTYLIHPQVLSIFKHLKSNPIRHHCSSLSHHPLSWGPLWWTSTFHSPAVIDFSPSSQSDLFQTLSMMRYFSGFTFFNGSLCKKCFWCFTISLSIKNNLYLSIQVYFTASPYTSELEIDPK